MKPKVELAVTLFWLSLASLACTGTMYAAKALGADWRLHTALGLGIGIGMLVIGGLRCTASGRDGGGGMNEIDKLEGKELAAAVAAKIGMVYIAGMWWAVDNDGVQHSTGMGEWTTTDYRPDLNIAQAFELPDGDRWEWQSNEYPHRLLITISARPGSWTVHASAWLEYFPTKSAAYATARCRAWLKAKAAMAL